MTENLRPGAWRLGDRHLRPNAAIDAKFGAPPEGRTVRLVASEPLASTLGGQHTLWLAVTQIARQFGMVAELEIVVPPVPLLPGVAHFGEGSDLAAVLADAARLVAGDALTVSVAPAPSGEADVALVLGGAVGGPARAAVSVLGCGWRCFAGDPAEAPDALPEGPNPFGPYLAACLGAGEVFKRLRGLRPGRGEYAERLFLSVWDGRRYDSWGALPPGRWDAGLSLPPAYLIGAGAVGQAAAAALAATGLSGYLTSIDGETVDDTNLNRYPLATLEDVGVDKSALVASRLAGSGIRVFPSPKCWPDYAYDGPYPNQRADLRDLEKDRRYGLVLSCVDKNPARRAIQAFWPGVILGGSTSDLSLEVNSYDMLSPYECLSCFNQDTGASPTVGEVAAELRKLDPDERRAAAGRIGLDVEKLEAYLANPKCGMLGHGEAARFHNEMNAVWSVGFVSAVAGTLLAAQVVLRELGGPGALPTAKDSMLRFAFHNLNVSHDRYRRDSLCNCAGSGRTAYEKLWGERNSRETT